MLKTVKPVFFGLVCVALVTSCKKDVLDDNAAPGTAAAEKVNVDSAVNADYYPYRNGITYSYVDSTGGAAKTTESAVKVLGDTSIDGKSFSKTAAAGSSVTNFQHSADGVTTMVSFNGEDKITTTLLKANEPVGTVWTDNFSNGGVPSTYEWKIVAKGLTRTVMGVEYRNVIQVHLNGTAEVASQGKVVFADADYFYAPNVGLVENISYNTKTGKAELHRVLQGSK